jgi:BirA family biotin operon repressor/biotin-[acetyl-CoA-carboxylase] ligase
VKVCEAIEAVADKSPLIKWVNDIFLDRKKICGILTEAVADFESGGVQWIVLGIGVNFSADKNSFPDDLRQVAGAVFPSGSHSVTRNQLAAEIINRILHHSERDYEEALGGYKRRMMMLGKKISVVGPEGTYRATAVDIDDTGRLIVQTEGGETRVLSSGEISIRK